MGRPRALAGVTARGDQTLADLARSLLDQCGVPTDEMLLLEGIEGGNNRIRKLVAAGRSFVLKTYVVSAADGRDRLGAEWAFLQCAHRAGVGDIVPVPFAVARDSAAALYGFMDGRKVRASEIDAGLVGQCAAFIERINAPGMRREAQDVADASESAFSIRGHFDILERRRARLEAAREWHDDALSFFLDRMDEVGERVRSRVAASARRLNLDPEAVLEDHERCLSPSDFGFHNALLLDDGRLGFVDFEYAGWDDPAKLAADFVYQPAVPVPDRFYDRFSEACIGHLNEDVRDCHRRRARILQPVFGLRWCCIILNPFERHWRERQQRSLSAEEYRALCRERLALAERTLDMTEGLLFAGANQEAYR